MECVLRSGQNQVEESTGNDRFSEGRLWSDIAPSASNSSTKWRRSFSRGELPKDWFYGRLCRATCPWSGWRGTRWGLRRRGAGRRPHGAVQGEDCGAGALGGTPGVGDWVSHGNSKKRTTVQKQTCLFHARVIGTPPARSPSRRSHSDCLDPPGGRRLRGAAYPAPST